MSTDKMKYIASPAPQQQPALRQGIPMGTAYPPQAIPSPDGSGARKYVGDVATGYDAKRMQSPKWIKEQEVIEGIIDDLPEGTKILDCPVGTGRFFKAYERNNHLVMAVDLSEDMLCMAHAKVTNPDLFTFGHGHIGQLDTLLEENSVDVAIMCRLTRWLTSIERTEAMAQLKLVAKDAIVFTARVDNHQYAYTYDDIKRDLGEDWAITHDWSCDGIDYCVIRAEPTDELA